MILFNIVFTWIQILVQPDFVRIKKEDLGQRSLFPNKVRKIH